jgi:hypothetical protein
VNFGERGKSSGRHSLTSTVKPGLTVSWTKGWPPMCVDLVKGSNRVHWRGLRGDDPGWPRFDRCSAGLTRLIRPLVLMMVIKNLGRHTLQHANSARGTRVPLIINACLHLGSNVADSSRTQAGLSRHKRTQRKCQVSGINSPARPHGGLNANTVQPPFNAPWRTTTCKKTSQQCRTVDFTCIPFMPLPLASIKERGGQPSQRLMIRTLTPHGLGLDTLSRQVCNPYYKQP